MLINKYLLGILFLFVLSSCAAMMLNIPTDVEQNAISNGAPVYIGAVDVGAPNSAGGKRVTYKWKNIGDFDIKYLTIRTDFYNRVDDKVTCRYGFGGSIRFTGPYDSGSYEMGSPRSLCYDSTATRGEIRSIRVEFMNGESQSFDRDELLDMGALHEDA